MTKTIIMCLLILGMGFSSCIPTTLSLLENITWDLEEDTCLYITDINATINWTPKDYDINITLLEGEHYNNIEANIEIYRENCTECEECITRDWAQIDLIPGIPYFDTPSETIYYCDGSCTMPDEYCYQNYLFEDTYNESMSYDYENLDTNTSIHITFEVPDCPECECNETICNETVCSWDNVNMETLNIECTNSAQALTNELHKMNILVGGCIAQEPLNCPECEECIPPEECITSEECEEFIIESNYIEPEECVCEDDIATSFNHSALMYYDGSECTSFTSVCRDYFYELNCNQEEADNGNLSKCWKRTFESKEKELMQCLSDKQSCLGEKEDMIEEEEKKGAFIDQFMEHFNLVFAGFIFIIFLIIITTLSFRWLKKEKYIGSEQYTPNKRIPKNLLPKDDNPLPNVEKGDE